MTDADGTQLVGVAEIADMFGLRDRTYVSRWWRKGKLPEPDYVLAMGPIWRLTPEFRDAIERLTT